MKKYIKPEIEIVALCNDGICDMVVTGSGELDPVDFGAKKHYSFFDDWDSEEKETSAFPRSKSVWDD